MRKITSRLIRGVQLCDSPSVVIRRFVAIGLFVFLAGLCQGCSKWPCVRKLKVDKTVVLKKGEYKLAVTLHKRLIGYNRQLGISIRNEGNTVYEGRCEMLTSISMQGTPEFIVAFVPKYTKQHIKNEIEPRGKERLLVGHRVTPPLDLAPGEECEYMGCEFSTPVKSKDVGFKCVGKLYAKHL